MARNSKQIAQLLAKVRQEIALNWEYAIAVYASRGDTDSGHRVWRDTIDEIARLRLMGRELESLALTALAGEDGDESEEDDDG